MTTMTTTTMMTMTMTMTMTMMMMMMTMVADQRPPRARQLHHARRSKHCYKPIFRLLPRANALSTVLLELETAVVSRARTISEAGKRSGVWTRLLPILGRSRHFNNLGQFRQVVPRRLHVPAYRAGAEHIFRRRPQQRASAALRLAQPGWPCRGLEDDRHPVTNPAHEPVGGRRGDREGSPDLAVRRVPQASHRQGCAVRSRERPRLVAGGRRLPTRRTRPWAPGNAETGKRPGTGWTWRSSPSGR